MSLIRDLISSACIHEAGHSIVAQALGETPRMIDVFGLNKHLAPGEADAFSYYSEFTPPLHHAIISVAGEAAEQFCKCPFVLTDHLLAWKTVHLRELPKPGTLHYPPVTIGDGAKFVAAMMKVGTNTPMQFLDECTTRARNIISEYRAVFWASAADLERYAIAGGVGERLPNEIPGDGPHWFIKRPGRPLITTIREYVSQWLEFSPAAAKFRN